MEAASLAGEMVHEREYEYEYGSPSAYTGTATPPVDAGEDTCPAGGIGNGGEGVLDDNGEME